MMLTGSSESFTSFGPSAFLRRRPEASIELVRDRREVRRHLREACPKAAGVYGMVDRGGRLIYVGTSIRLRDRLMDYFQGGEDPLRQPRDGNWRKELRIARRATGLVWEVVGHELLALLRELELIRRFQPELNVRGRNKRRLCYLYLSNEEAPRLRVGSRLPQGCKHHWGPLSGKGHLVRVADWLNRHFKLADCPERVRMHFADQREFFDGDERPGCLRGEVEACLAPCVGLCSRQQYAVQMRRVRAFLDGASDEPLQLLRDEIQTAVDRWRFEHAARLRDTLDDLERLCDRLVLQRRPQRHDFVFPARMGRRTMWILVHAGQVLAARREPCSPVAASRWLERLQSLVQTEPDSLDDRDAADARLVAAWFRGRPEQLASTISFDAAAENCRRLLTSAC